MTEKVSWPAWYYGPKGEAQIFEKVEDVPKGWQDNPNKFKKAAPKPEGEDEGGGEDGGENSETGGLTREQIVADLERRKVFYKASASTKTLYRLLTEAVEAEA